MLAALSDNDRPLSIGSFTAVAGAHVLALWGILAMSQIAPQIIDIKPVYVEFIEPAAPEPVKPPEPETPPPPRPVEKPVKKQLIATQAEPTPTAIETPPEPAPPEPLPPVQAAAPVVEAPPAAKPSAPPSCFRANFRGQPPKAPYPIRSQQLGETGRVLVTVIISTTGKAKSATVKTTSGFKRLDDAAVRTALRTDFLPNELDGEPVEARVDVPYEFGLTDKPAGDTPVGSNRLPC